MNGKTLKKAALCIALGTCIASMAPMVMAQNVNGAVAGRASAGDQITVTNTATGLTRTATANADGSYRLSQLPVGDYSLQVKRDGQPVGNAVAVNVSLGGTTTVNLGAEGGVVNLDSLQVIGSRVINRVDVRSTESATNVTREDLARLPVDQSIAAVVNLAPGVNSGNASFGGLSFAGSSVAENAVFINGLNVTDIYNRQGFSTTPFAFFQEFQVKTGGYSVEFGRSTGGVINAVTRSGSNEFHGGAEVTLEPSGWRSSADNHFHKDGSVHSYASHDKQSFSKTNVWASGPVVKDKLFLFAMYEDRNNRSKFTNNVGTTLTNSEANDGFWGAKLDWNISDNHLLELLAFNDESETEQSLYGYDFDTYAKLDPINVTNIDGGGQNWSATYTGHFGNNFVAKAMYGINNRNSLTRSNVDELCSRVTYDVSSYGQYVDEIPLPSAIGCGGSNSVVTRDNEREAARLDFEWTLGDHLIRFGADREVMTTEQSSRYPGPTGMTYTAIGVEPGDELFTNNFVPDGVFQALRARRRVDGGTFETEANAYYIEDIWNVTPNLLVNIGVRWDNFDNRAANGNSFIKMDNLVAPRMGFSWDMKGDGSTKLYGNLGRYYLPVTNNINVTFAGGLTDEYTYYALDGWTIATNPATGLPYSTPIIGAQLGPTDTSMNAGGGDLRQSVDRDLEAVYQDEAILGFQSMIDQAWSWGVNATYRRMTRALDDVRINHTPCGPVGFNLYPIANPGETLTIWGDESIGCETEGWITIDTSKDGYIKGGSGEVVGYSDPKRTYKAVEFQIDRAWDGKWALNVSYLWSKSEGNFEGPVNSELGYADTGMVQHWDHPANNDRYGVLFNDHEHQIKVRGSYALNDQWLFGGTLNIQSGAPITAYGVTWPGDTTSAGSFTNEYGSGGSSYICVSRCRATPEDPTWTYADRVYRFTGRGDYGRMPWTYNLGATVVWTLPVEDVDFKVRFSVYNLLNQKRVTNVHTRYEGQPGGYRTDTFGTGTGWQSPRYMQLVATYNF
ncbi:TonB-dependent receptor [Pseudoxanthomonas japonensis]|nr:TonB-dependent receptor [Pseudoxanthomonas japonensis]